MKMRRGSDTEVSRRILGSATSDYNTKLTEVRKMMSYIDRTLKEHAKNQKEDPNNYGYVGDLGHILKALGEAIQIIPERG